MMLLGASLCYAGFSALCLAMDRHHQDLLGAKPGRQRQWILRWVGGVLLALALGLLIAKAGWAMGLVRGLAVAMASAGVLVALLPYWPRAALALAAGAVPAALVAGVY